MHASQKLQLGMRMKPQHQVTSYYAVQVCPAYVFYNFDSNMVNLQWKLNTNWYHDATPHGLKHSQTPFLQRLRQVALLQSKEMQI